MKKTHKIISLEKLKRAVDIAYVHSCKKGIDPAKVKILVANEPPPDKPKVVIHYIINNHGLQAGKN
jgi:hypothetical protein